MKNQVYLIGGLANKFGSEALMDVNELVSFLRKLDPKKYHVKVNDTEVASVTFVSLSPKKATKVKDGDQIFIRDDFQSEELSEEVFVGMEQLVELNRKMVLMNHADKIG